MGTLGSEDRLLVSKFTLVLVNIHLELARRMKVGWYVINVVNIIDVYDVIGTTAVLRWCP